MVAATRQLSLNAGSKSDQEKVNLDKTYVWVDFGSIPQASRMTQMLAVSTLPAVSSSLHSFVIVAPQAHHEKSGEVCNFESYKRRGWCRAEVASHASRRGFENMYIANCLTKVKHIDELHDVEMSELVHVFSGDFTCCQLLHPQRVKCDKEELVSSMLGLYCDVYKRRLSPKLSKFYGVIEDQGKERVFPDTVRVEFQDGTSEVRPLFSDLIEMVEKLLDFENMVEAAGGELSSSSDAVQYEKEYDAEERELMKEDANLLPILINQFELKFDNKQDEVILGRGAFGKGERAKKASLRYS